MFPKLNSIQGIERQNFLKYYINFSAWQFFKKIVKIPSDGKRKWKKVYRRKIVKYIIK